MSAHQPKDFLFHYLAQITSVYDADTVTCNIDLGFGFGWRKRKIRLFGINAPEVRGPEREEGKYSRDILRDLILDETVVLQTYYDKTGKYGRYLGVIWLIDGTNVNEYLIENDLADINFYGTRPLPKAA